MGPFAPVACVAVAISPFGARVRVRIGLERKVLVVRIPPRRERDIPRGGVCHRAEFDLRHLPVVELPKRVNLT